MIALVLLIFKSKRCFLRKSGTLCASV